MKETFEGNFCGALDSDQRFQKWQLRPVGQTEPIECLLQKANGPSYEFYENEQMTVTGKRINVYGVPGNIEPSALPLVVESFWTPRFSLRIIG